MRLTLLENDILDWIAKTYGNDKLRKQIGSVIGVKREHTGVGFYTYLAVPESIAVAGEDESLQNPLVGPGIQSDDLEYGGECLLWLDAGTIHMLEVYSFGDVLFPKNLRQFALYDSRD